MVRNITFHKIHTKVNFIRYYQIFFTVFLFLFLVTIHNGNIQEQGVILQGEGGGDENSALL